MATSSITGIGEVERRDLVAAGLRAVLSAGVLLAAYCLVPVGTRHRHHGVLLDVAGVARLGVAIAIFIVVLTLEIRAITRARHPMLRAGVAMAVVLPLFLLFFSWTYVTVSAADPRNFGAPLDKTQAFYFTVTVFSTVGFGDITPKTDLARLLTTFQMLADLAVIAVVIRLILGVARESTAGARAARTAEGDAPAPGADTAPSP